LVELLKEPDKLQLARVKPRPQKLKKLQLAQVMQ
jgi:hypothetical protein